MPKFLLQVLEGKLPERFELDYACNQQIKGELVALIQGTLAKIGWAKRQEFYVINGNTKDHGRLLLTHERGLGALEFLLQVESYSLDRALQLGKDAKQAVQCPLEQQGAFIYPLGILWVTRVSPDTPVKRYEAYIKSARNSR